MLSVLAILVKSGYFPHQLGPFGIPAPTFRPLGAAVAPEPQKIPGVACETSQDLLIIIRAAA
jgi:hypothetical protein